MYHMHQSHDIDELNTWKNILDHQVTTGVIESSITSTKEEVVKLLIESLRDFQRNEVTNEALRHDMANISR